MLLKLQSQYLDYRPKKNKMLIMSVKNGWQNTISSTKAIQRRQQKNLAHSMGPHSCEPSTKGFQLHLRRPTGGGK